MRANHSIVDEQELLRALQTAGMNAKVMEQFMERFRSVQSDKGKQILLSYRSNLLSDVHAEQNKLYVLDFIIRKLKSNKDL